MGAKGLAATTQKASALPTSLPTTLKPGQEGLNLTLRHRQNWGQRDYEKLHMDIRDVAKKFYNNRRLEVTHTVEKEGDLEVFSLQLSLHPEPFQNQDKDKKQL